MEIQKVILHLLPWYPRLDFMVRGQYVRLVRQECKRQKCERHQCEANKQCECQQCERVNSAGESAKLMPNVRMSAVRCDTGAKKARQQCERQQCGSPFFFLL